MKKVFLFFITVLLLSCEKNSVTNDDDSKLKADVEQVYNEMTEQGFLENMDLNQFLNNTEEAQDKFEIEIKTSYNDITNKSTTSISITPIKESTDDITIIALIPKIMAENITDITFYPSSPIVIKEDPLIMWHFAAVDERIDLNYETDGNDNSTSKNIIAIGNYEIPPPSNKPIVELDVSEITATTVNVTINVSSNGNQIGEVYVCLQHGGNLTWELYKIGAGSGEHTMKIENLEPETGYAMQGEIHYNTNVYSYFGGMFFITKDSSVENLIDCEGNSYKTVKIGEQIWMAENLKTTKYNDGTTIPVVTNNSSWVALSTPAYCWYNNDASTYKTAYGALYNWYVANSIANGGKNVCPTGWHVPSDPEWTTLTNYLGGETIAGGKLKESGTSHWNSPNNATNLSGFTALPSGLRGPSNGLYYYLGQGGYWWSSTERISTDGWARQLFNNKESVLRELTGNDKKHGFSIRCIKD